MESDRIAKVRELVEKSPKDERARYFLAHELFKAQDWTGAAEQYRAYLELAPDDEGAAFKSLGQCLENLGRVEEATEVYRKGREVALAHHHEGLAGEIQFLLEQLEEAAS